MRILGIDPGINLMGFGIIDKTTDLKVVDYGVINTPKTDSLPLRLTTIFDGVKELIETYNPDAIAIEELFYFKNQKTIIPVAEARGVIVTAGYKFCGSLYEYTPLQIKQALTGNGRAEKKQIQEMVKLILGLNSIPKPDDAADALAVAICHSQTNNFIVDNSMC